MRVFKKINLGAILFLVVVISVVSYMVYMTKKHSSLDKSAELFVNSFFESDKDWRTVPSEFRNNPQGYADSIEQEVKKYLDDDAYSYYLKYAILSQFEKNSFIEEEEFEPVVEYLSSTYEDEIIKVEIWLDTGNGSNVISFDLRESDSTFKIEFLNYPLVSENIYGIDDIRGEDTYGNSFKY